MEDKRFICLGKNLDVLSKRTKNFSDVLERLEEYDVLTPSEIDHLNCCSDEETSICMLYSIVAQKPTSNFNLLLYVLQDTDNDELARLLEESLRKGELVLKLEKEADPLDLEHNRSHEADSILISGGELGISELLDEYPQLTRNWKRLFHLVKLPNSCVSKYKHEENFILQSTLILRDWSDHLKKRATVGNLCAILENDGHQNCAGRIRRMFRRYIDSGMGFDFPQSGSFKVSGKIRLIASILDNNPSFCFHPERLLLMLNLPLDSLPEFVHDSGQGTGARFASVAEKMLSLWLDLKAASASTDHLASLLAINGHFHTSSKSTKKTRIIPENVEKSASTHILKFCTFLEEKNNTY